MILNLEEGSAVVWLKRREYGVGVVREIRQVTAVVSFSHGSYNCPIEELLKI